MLTIKMYFKFFFYLAANKYITDDISRFIIWGTCGYWLCLLKHLSSPSTKAVIPQTKTCIPETCMGNKDIQTWVVKFPCRYYLQLTSNNGFTQCKVKKQLIIKTINVYWSPLVFFRVKKNLYIYHCSNNS